MKTFTILSIPLLLLGCTDAVGLPTKPKPTGCAVITGALSVLKSLQAPATSFCSAYLHLSASTTTATTYSTFTTTKTVDTVFTTYTATTPPNKKRDLKARAKGYSTPSQLTKYPAASISSACSCLGLVTPTPTITTTTSITTTTDSVTATQTVCVAPNGYCSFASGAAPCCPGYACAAFADGNFCYPE